MVALPCGRGSVFSRTYNKVVRRLILVGCLATAAFAQTPPVEKLAESGHCREALPLLKTAITHVTDPETKKRLGLDGVHCGMSLHDLDSAAGFLRGLSTAFPNDPEVLYLTVHVYSDLSVRASQKLMVTAPTSYQVRLLNGEALEEQGKWEEAIAEYREVLNRNPNLPGIHYRVGRLVLTLPKSDENKKAAQLEFEAELKIDPSNAGAEYILGELARQDQQFPAAIGHFEHATKLDAGFADAFIGLGRAMLEAGRNADAVAPLQMAAKLRPDNPAPHFYLSTAYRRTGHPEEAQRELALHEQATEKVRQMKQEIETGAPETQKVVH